jgi:hypothetical protein
MSVKQSLVEEKLLSAPALAEAEPSQLSMPTVERVGLLVILHSDLSRRIPFTSGAMGHTNSQVHIAGKLPGEGEGEMVHSLQGNVLVVPRAALIDTHREIAPYGTSLSFGGKHLLQSINEVLMGRDIKAAGMDAAEKGVRYDACISLFDEVKGWEEVIVATSGSPDLLRLTIP